MITARPKLSKNKLPVPGVVRQLHSPELSAHHISFTNKSRVLCERPDLRKMFLGARHPRLGLHVSCASRWWLKVGDSVVLSGAILVNV